MKQSNISAILAASTAVKHDIKLMLGMLACDKAAVRAFAIDSGSTQYFARMAMQNVSEDRIHLRDGLKEFSVELLVLGKRGHGQRESLNIPMDALTSLKARAKWIKGYNARMDAAANKHHVYGEMRAREHQRAMARLPKAQREQVIQAADKIQSK